MTIPPLTGPYSRTLPGVLWWSEGGGQFLMSEVPLHTSSDPPSYAGASDVMGWGFGFGVWGLRFGVWGLGFGVEGLGIRASSSVSVYLFSPLQ